MVRQRRDRAFGGDRQRASWSAGVVNILRVIGSTDPRTGGPIEGLRRTSEAMAALGCRNEVLCLDDPQSPWLADFPLPVHAVGPGLGRYGYTSRFAAWLRANRKNYDAVIAHGLWNYSSVGTWRALKDTSTPYAVFSHGMLDPWFRGASPAKHLAKQAYWLALEGRALATAYAVLFTTEMERSLARGVFFGARYRERVVAYGASDAPEGESRQGAAFRSVLPSLGERPYLVFLSRIHPKKGCDLLLEGFAKIAPSHPELDLVMAGPDQTGWQKTLVQQAASLGIARRVHWPGMLSGDAKWGALRGARGFVLPSHQENFGIAVAEALACGTPVLISDQVNICREVEAARAGFVAPDTAAGVDELLRRFLALDNAEHRAMSAAARGAFLERFDVRMAARDLVALAREMSCRPS
jgi:glycosyltransferase involved in cell wall biosynthesis